MPENRFTKSFAEAHAAFNGQYKNELNDLLGLSKVEIDAIVPGTADLQIYYALIKVVDNASKQNLAQAELIEDIKELGEVAVTIAKKVPKISHLF